jgi:transcriptional antiterminator NusG
MKLWYVVQVYAGYENAVRDDILKSVNAANLQNYLDDVLIPCAKMKQFFTSDSDNENQQLFPGYILVHIEAVPEVIRLIENTPRVIKFLGGKTPIPLSQKEVNKILSQIKGEVVLVNQENAFEKGCEVEIKSGPFEGFVGIIEDINRENEKLTVMVSIFGRMTPVELTFDQVKR